MLQYLNFIHWSSSWMRRKVWFGEGGVCVHQVSIWLYRYFMKHKLRNYVYMKGWKLMLPTIKPPSCDVVSSKICLGAVKYLKYCYRIVIHWSTSDREVIDMKTHKGCDNVTAGIKWHIMKDLTVILYSTAGLPCKCNSNPYKRNLIS